MTISQLLTDQEIVSSRKIRSDTYSPGEFHGDAVIEAMVNLTGFQDHNLTAQA